MSARPAWSKRLAGGAAVAGAVGGRPRRYELSGRRQRALVYEFVLTEGTDDDVRYFIEVDELVRLWDDLVLPPHVRHAWSEWLTARLNITV